MTDLIADAEAAGLSPRWKDVHGELHEVAPETLRRILDAIGGPSAVGERPLVTALVGSLGRTHLLDRPVSLSWPDVRITPGRPRKVPSI